MPPARILAVLVLVLIASLLSGCGREVESHNPAGGPPDPQARSQSQAPSGPVAIADPVQRCLMQPAPDGLQWDSELLAALCADHFNATPDAATYKRLIDAKDWKQLRLMHDYYLARHHDEQDPEYLLYRLYPRTGWSKPGEGEAYARRWHRAMPKDPYANYVRGRQTIDRALDVRGEGLEGKVPPEKLRQSRALAREASAMLRRAIAAEHRLIPAYTLMIDAYALAGQQEGVDMALQSALRRAPHSYYPRARALIYSNRKWGGKNARMNAIVRDGRSWVGRNPRMQLLQPLVDFQRGDFDFQHASWQKAYRRQREVLARGPLYGALMQTGRSAAEMERYGEAIEYYTQAMRFTDDPGNALIARGVAMERMGDYAAALTDYRAAEPYEPSRRDIAARAAAIEKMFKRVKNTG